MADENNFAVSDLIAPGGWAPPDTDEEITPGGGAQSFPVAQRMGQSLNQAVPPVDTAQAPMSTVAQVSGQLGTQLGGQLPTRQSDLPDPNDVRNQMYNSPRLPNGARNSLSTSAIDEDVALVQGMARDGRINPRTAGKIEQTLLAQRKTQVDSTIKFYTDVTDLNKKNLDLDETRVRMAVIGQNYQGPAAADVVGLIKDGKIDQAKIYVQRFNENAPPNMQLPTDLSNPETLSRFTYLASESPVAKQRIGAQAAAEKKRLREDEPYFEKKKIAPGVLVEPGTGRSYELDNLGNKTYLSSADVQARGGATGGASGTGGVVTGGGGEGTGNINGLKRDKLGNITLDPALPKRLGPLSKSASSGARILGEMDTIDKEGAIENAPESWFGDALANVQQGVGYAGETRGARDSLSRFANSALGIIESPLMKGAPSEPDARRALSVMNDPKSSAAQKRQAFEMFRSAVKTEVDGYEASIDQFDKPTRERLKGLGIDTVKPLKSKESSARGGRDYTIEERDAEIARRKAAGLM